MTSIAEEPRFGRRQVEKLIHRFCCLLNKETCGNVSIERSRLRFKYELHRYEINVEFPKQLKTYQVINKIAQQMGARIYSGDKFKYEGISEFYIICGETIPSVMFEKAYETENSIHYRFSFKKEDMSPNLKAG